MTDDPFVAHRSLLFTVAYELLGSAADAEDAVQETWLRWDGIGAGGQAEVADSRAYLVRIVTRQALNRLRLSLPGCHQSDKPSSCHWQVRAACP